MSKESRTFKCAIVGDPKVGKTSLVMSYTHNYFPTFYIPICPEPVTTRIKCDSKTVNLDLWEMAGDENYDRLRPLVYPEMTIFMLCFSIVSPVSFDNVSTKWIPEIRQHCPEAPILLVGTKLDLRENQDQQRQLAAEGRAPITKAQAQKCAQKIRAVRYIECSALTQEGLAQVFEEAARSMLPPLHAKQKKSCTII